MANFANHGVCKRDGLEKTKKRAKNNLFILLKESRYAGIHKFYSKYGGWAWLTDRYGVRYKLDATMSQNVIDNILNRILERNRK